MKKNIDLKTIKKIQKILIVFILGLLVLLFVKNKLTKSIYVYNGKKLDLYSEQIVRDMSADQGISELEDGGLPEEHSMWDLFTFPMSFIASAIGLVARGLVYLIVLGIMSIIDVTLGQVGGKVQRLTIESVLLNKIPLLNPEFWIMPAKNIEGFYTTTASLIRGITITALVLQVFVLIVIAIKAMIRTLSLRKYVTQKQLQTDIDKVVLDWLMGIIILFGIVFYAALLIGVNNTFVNILGESIKIDGKDISSKLEGDIFSFNLMQGTVSLLLYIVLRIQAVTLFVMYLKRFIKLMFLIIISPLIATTYAIDRINDGKSQALATWNKMFVQTVFMQTIHIVVYISTVSILIHPGNDTFSLAGLVLSILGVNFLFTADKIIYNMFRMDQKETGSLVGASKLASKMVWASTAKKAISGGIKFGRTKMDLIRDTTEEIAEDVKDENKKAKEEKEKEKEKQKAKANNEKNVNTNTEEVDVKDKDQEKEENKEEALEEIKNQKLNIVDRASLNMTKMGINIKTKLYDKFGMNAPKELYEAQLKNKEKNLKLKQIHKKKQKQIKKATRKERTIRKATSIIAGTGTFMVKLGTQELDAPSVFSSIETGRNVAGGIKDAKKDKKTQAKSKEKSGARTNKEQENYEKTVESYQRVGETKLKKEDKDTNKHQLKKDEAVKNMLVSTKMKQELSGKNFDANTKEGKENLEQYNKAFETVNASQTSEYLNKNVKENKEKLEKYLKDKQGKTDQEIQMVLGQIEELVKQGVSLKTNTESPEVKNYMSSLVDMRYFVDREQYESISENFNGSFTNDILEDYLNNTEKYDEQEKQSEKEYDEESFDIDYYNI